ncbi:hypothetical protein GCK72_022634 [Caenorhabditis remanei]|uniref:Uncharacterized protein n=1 Tax=Caenorhabditis remanei TaxID=31234 RepID=A0A6A5FUX0_CAERE|nr:hypothetical protein GCK72_022634 [Caenorhabditis remanei]KAF1746181.1 hypothetical protein GCK72_022634 [Caenorhabditis remanei]
MTIRTYMQFTTMVYRYCTETYQLGFRACVNVMDRAQEDLKSIRGFIAVKVDAVTRNCQKIGWTRAAEIPQHRMGTF